MRNGKNHKNGQANGKDKHKKAIEIHRQFERGRQSPTVGAVLAVLRQEGLSSRQVREEGGPHPSTLHNWSERKTRMPRHESLENALHAAGHEFAIVRRSETDNQVRAPRILDSLPDRVLTSARPRFVAFRDPAEKNK